MTQLILLITLVISLLISPYLQAKNVILFLGDGMGVSTITPHAYLPANRKGKRARSTNSVSTNFATSH